MCSIIIFFISIFPQKQTLIILGYVQYLLEHLTMNNDENLKTTISEKMVTKTTVLIELVLLITTCRVS